MKTWEIDVDVRVRKTLRLAGPPTEESVREVIASMLRANVVLTGITLGTLQKWLLEEGRGWPPHPVEHVIEDGVIVDVREVTNAE